MKLLIVILFLRVAVTQAGSFLETRYGDASYGFAPLAEFPFDHPESRSEVVSTAAVNAADNNARDAKQIHHASVFSDTEVTIFVTSLVDEAVNTSACSSVSTQHLCSLRSALLLCSELLSASILQPSNTTLCVVSLPHNDNILIDPRKGSISLTSFLVSDAIAMRGEISVIGNGCTVTMDSAIASASGSSCRFLQLEFPSQSDNFHIHLENFTISNFGNIGLDGGGVFLTNVGSGSLNNITFRGNVADNGGGLLIDGSSDLSIRSCVFEENNASTYGGGAFILEKSLRISFSDCLFRANFAVDDGGGAHVRTANDYVSFTSCKFVDNICHEDGGGVYVREKNDYLSFTDCLFLNNFVWEDGGGIYVRTDNYYATLEGCEFTSNVALEGGAGAAIRSNNYYMNLRQCQFDNNQAEGYGGAVYLITYNTEFQVHDCTFADNIAKSFYGGAIFLVSLNHDFHIFGSRFLNNSAGQAGGAIFSSTFNSHMILQDNLFDKNTAVISGGTLYFGIDHDNAFMANCSLKNSIAETGGAVFISSYNDNFIIESSQMHNNSANSGGAIASYTHSLYIISSDFEYNHASQAGMGLFTSNLPLEAQFHILNTSISNNFASGGSGGLDVSLINKVVIHQCYFLNNTAQGGDGGAVKVESVTTLHISKCYFAHNGCYKNGGALYMEIPSSLDSVVVDSIFHHNTASFFSGGAVYLTRTRRLLFNNTLFTSNVADDSGGAIYARTSKDQISLTGCTFNGNIAAQGDGSAIYIADGNSFMEIYFCIFEANSAINGAGTVFWTFSYVELLEPAGLKSGSNVFMTSNTAKYGKFVATQGISLTMGENQTSSIEITDYSTFVPSFTLILVDYYGQGVLTQSEKEVTVTSIPSNCLHSSGYLTGTSTVIWSEGVATFDQLQAYCAPGYSMNLLVTYESSEGDVDPKINITLAYRDCLRGEYLAQERSCSMCPNGTYSLTEPNEVDLIDLTEIKVCKPCPEFADFCYGEHIVALPGYWRNSESTATLQECPFDTQACSGGYGVGDVSCEDGFEGPRCAVCQADFTFSPFTRTCTKCSSSYVEVVILFSLILCILLVVYSIWRKYSSLKSDSNSETVGEVFSYLVIRSKVLGENISPQVKIQVEDQVDVLRKRIVGLLRVFLTYFQVITILPLVLETNFEVFVAESFLPFETTVHLDITYFARGIDSCSDFSQSWDLINDLYFNTIYPIVVIIVMAVVYHVHSRVSRLELITVETGKSKIYMSRLLRRYVFFTLLFLYMIFPSVSSVIFSVFSCSDADPDDIYGGEDTYLNSDFSISCTSSRYRTAKIYAIFMVFLYPIGIPAMFFSVLYYYRNGIKTRTKVDKVNQPCYVIEFLWFPFSPSFWYFECIDIVYRVSVTGFLVLIHRGSAEQVVVALFLSFVYVQLHQHVLPHEDKWVQNIKIMSIWQIFIFLSIILLVKSDVFLGESWAVSAAVFVVIFLPLFLAILFIIFVYIRYQQLKSEQFSAPESCGQGSLSIVDDGVVTLVLRTTMCMRDSSLLHSSRPTLHTDGDNISLVELKQRRSDRVDENQ